MLTISELNVGYGQSRVIQDASFQVHNEEVVAVMVQLCRTDLRYR